MKRSNYIPPSFQKELRAMGFRRKYKTPFATFVAGDFTVEYFAAYWSNMFEVSAYDKKATIRVPPMTLKEGIEKAQAWLAVIAK